MSELPLTGHCLCGAVSYTLDSEPISTVLCHCDDCQRQSGAAFSINALVTEDDLHIEGEMKTYETVGTETGEKRERRFCPACGTPIITVLAEMEGMVALKAGTMDDRSVLAPEMEVWHERSHDWLKTDEERGVFERGLPT